MIELALRFEWQEVYFAPWFVAERHYHRLTIEGGWLTFGLSVFVSW